MTRNTQGSGSGAGSGPAGGAGTGPKKQRRPHVTVQQPEGSKS